MQQQQYYNAAAVQSLQTRKAPAPQQQRLVPGQHKGPSMQQSQVSPPQLFRVSQQQQGPPQLFQISQDQQMPPSCLPTPSQQEIQQPFGGSSAEEYPGAFDIDFNRVVEHDEHLLSQYGNDPDPTLDLGADGAFSQFKVLFGTFYHSTGVSTLVPALKKKGFQVTCAQSVISFLDQLEKGEYDVVCFVSAHKKDPHNLDERFKELILNAYRNGTGIFMFADNRPFFHHCNLVLPTIGDCTLIGNDHGNQKLVFGDPKEPGRFDMEHLLFSGINSMYEGVTISFPTERHSLKVLATNTHGHPVICVKDSDETHGRVVVDVGFTKLNCSWEETGQARYIVNACVWLVDLERRGEVEPIKARG